MATKTTTRDLAQMRTKRMAELIDEGLEKEAASRKAFDEMGSGMEIELALPPAVLEAYRLPVKQEPVYIYSVVFIGPYEGILPKVFEVVTERERFAGLCEDNDVPIRKATTRARILP